MEFYKQLDPHQCYLKVILIRQAITDEEMREKTGKILTQAEHNHSTCLSKLVMN